jgi:thioredoxin reductase
VLLSSIEMLEFAIMLRGWTRDVVALTGNKFPIPADTAERAKKAGVVIEERQVVRLVGKEGHLEHAELHDGSSIPLDVLFARPPQRQVPIIRSLGLTLNSMGYVEVHETHRETSVPGIYAAGDLVSPAQAAIMAAAAGTFAAAMINHELTIELATNGLLA